MSGRGNDFLLRLRQNAGLASAVALFAVLYVVYNLIHPKGFSPQVFVQNADEFFALALLGMAQTLPVLAGGLDLSVGAVMTLVNCLASTLVNGSPVEMALGILLCLAAGAASGFLNGAIVVYGRLQPIIATLATGAIALGLALFLRPKPGGKIDEDLSWALTNTLGDFADTYGLFDGGKASWFQPIAGLPVAAILLLLVVILVWLPLRRTVTGRTIYAIGSAEDAAFMSGLPIARAKLTAFTLAGLLAGIGGLFSPFKPPRAMRTSRRPAPTRSTPSPPSSSAARLCSAAAAAPWARSSARWCCASSLSTSASWTWRRCCSRWSRGSCCSPP